MDLSQPASLTETLANLSVAWILAIVTGLTVLRLGLIRIPDAWSRSVAEVLESGIIAIVLVFLIIRPFFVQAYFIPSPSMEPTLLGNNGVGDRILVNKLSYRFHKPGHDNVVVFLAPKEAMEGNPDFIKRLIGVPGDRIQVHAGVVTIDGNEYHHNTVRQSLATAGVFGPDAISNFGNDLQASHHVKFVPDGVLADGQLIGKQRLAEILTSMPNAQVSVTPGYVVRNGQRLSEPFTAEDPDYSLDIYQGKPLKHDYDTGTDEYKLQNEIISKDDYLRDQASADDKIPPHRYLMMGDNRNDSNDSTNWGLLEDQRVVGKAQFIFWPPSRMHVIH